MKLCKKNLVFISLLVLLFTVAACEGDDSGNSTGETDDSGTEITAIKGKVLDADGNLVGYLVKAWKEDITVFTEKKYLVDIGWNGKIDPSNIKFTEEDAKGTAFYSEYDSYTWYGKSVFYDNQSDTVYVPKDVTDDGTASFVEGPITQKSYLSEGEYGNYENDWDYYLELKKSSRSEVGLPESISLPIDIVFE